MPDDNTFPVPAPDGVEITATIHLDPIGDRYDEDGNPVGPRSIMDAVVDSAARQLIKSYADYDFRRQLVERVARLRDEEIRAYIVPMIREAMNGTLQKTNEYGEPRGEPVSLTAVIMDEVKKALTLNTGNSFRSERSALTNVMREHIDMVITRELKAEVDAAKALVVKAIQDQGAKFLADAVTALKK